MGICLVHSKAPPPTLLHLAAPPTATDFFQFSPFFSVDIFVLGAASFGGAGHTYTLHLKRVHQLDEAEMDLWRVEWG